MTQARVVVTGAAGFIGSHLVDLLLSNTDWTVVGLDSFRHGGGSDRVSGLAISSDRYEIIDCDLASESALERVRSLERPEAIFNVASISSVDDSLVDPATIVKNNVDSLLCVLEWARLDPPTLFLQMSTDEVYGPTRRGQRFKEWSASRPSNPYSASKAAQEAIAFSYWRSYDLPLVICNATNVIGERQGRSKFIPLTVRKVLSGALLEIHCSGSTPGSRVYLDVRDCVGALEFIARKHLDSGPASRLMADVPDRYNIAGSLAVDNLEVAHRVGALLGREVNYRLVDIDDVRPGHDLHYGLDRSKLADAGWSPSLSFDESLSRTVKWFAARREWEL